MRTSGTTFFMALIMRSPLAMWLMLSEKSRREMIFLRSIVSIQSLKSSSRPAAYMPPTNAPIDVPATARML